MVREVSGPEPRAVQVGGLSQASLRAALDAAGVQLNDSAETLLDGPSFVTPDAESVQVIEFVERSVGELGLPDGATLPQILSAAHERGLVPCQPQDGPYLRLATLDQPNAPDTVLSNARPPSGAVHIASERVSDDYDVPRGFYLRVVDGTPWLRGYRCTDDVPWSSGDRFAFRSGGNPPVTAATS